VLTFRPALIAALCAVSFAAWSQSPADGKRRQTKPYTKQSQQQPADKQLGTDQSPIVVKVQPAPDAESKAAEDAKERKEKTELDRKLVEFNGQLAYYTQVLAWVAGLQFLALVAQSLVLVVSLRHTSKASRAAEVSAEVAKKTLVVSQRAYITGGTYHARPIKGTADQQVSAWEVSIIWTNTGNTPAMHVRCGAKFVEVPRGSKAIAPSFPITVKEGSAIGARGTVRAADQVTREQVERVSSGTSNIVLFGYCEYRDIFPDTDSHSATDSVRLSINDGTLSGANPFGYHAYYPDQAT